MAAEMGGRSFDECGLTRSQLMMWTGQRLQPDDPLYNMVLTFRIHGPIEIARFRKAFQTLIRNADALRTTFKTVGGVPRQRILADYEYQMEVVDLSTSKSVEADLSAWIDEHARRRFDLEDCLFESTLIKIADQEHIWFFNQHHLTTDAWSTSLIFRKMQEYYALDVAGRLDQAPALPAFRSYVEDEAKQRNSKAAERARAYWQERLESPSTPLSFYRAIPRSCSGRTVRMPCVIGSGRSAAVRALAQDGRFRALTADLARFQVFATAFFAWLYRVSGNRAVTVGTPNHNRASTRQKNTIGLFIEVYPLRVSVERDESFASLYRKVARRTTELLMNAPPGAIEFEHNRAFDAVLNYITANFGNFDGLPVESEWVHAGHGDRNHLVRMQVEDFDIDGEFRVFFDLNADTFQGDERDRPRRQFLRLLDAFIDRPEQSVAAVDILDEAERVDLARGFAPQRPGKVPERTVLDMFVEQAERTPDEVAISCGERFLSYAELRGRVDGVAAYLAANGVKRGDRVGVALPRSVGAVISFLAVMRCGAAYVPIDPTYPRQRIAGMLEEADISVVLAQSNTQVALPSGLTSLHIEVAQKVSSDAGEPKPASVDGDDTAYVIFTSGSTGRPKGVEVTHRNLANYVAWARRYYLDGEPLDWPLFSSLCFDMTVTSLYVPLVSGGRVIVYPETHDRREITVRRVIEDNAADIIKLTPSHLSLIQAIDLSASKLRKIVVGGENFRTDLARSISMYFGDEIEIYNEYGPTEGTVACTIHRFEPARDVDTTVPIGRALDNAEVYVLDERRALQPRGVIGELYIGGAGVARGYVNREDLTRARFVPNPFRAGETMYQTGDLVRCNPDGTLTCLGRADEQFKVNGIRVEPEEIEAALLEDPQITECAVRLVESSSKSEADEGEFCVRCGLSSMHPDAMLDEERVCRLCRVYETEADRARSYFGTMEDLQKIVEDAKQGARGEQDCMMLLSGGKDSSYALCQLVDLGLTPLVFTLENGYISEGAKANIRRIVDQLGLELVVGSTDAMSDIFADSLRRFSNVCNGCFKTIYTLSMKVARERGIRYIFTGLSRGQIFETRIADLFRQRIFDPATIDSTIIEARKAYHRARDAVTEGLDTRHLDDDSIFEAIQFVDFYRYTDVSLEEMLRYLRDHVPWVRPADTGRSTNCLINEVGIYVHKKERGYHNYALPYSWDVRLGHKERDAARDELDDDINGDNVQRILGEIGYRPRETLADQQKRSMLTAYYVAHQEIEGQALRAQLARRLPSELLPTHFVRLEKLPLTPNGKVDRDALPEPGLMRPRLAADYAAPETQVETTLARIWADVLGMDKVGVNDNFFDLGGDSILNIQIVAAAAKVGLRLSPQQIFDNPTIAELVKVVGAANDVASQQGPVIGPVPLTPIQLRFFETGLDDPRRYTQQVLISASRPIDTLVLEEAVRRVVGHHDALRGRYEQVEGGWRQTIDALEQTEVSVERIAAADFPDGDVDSLVEAHVARVQDRLDLGRGNLLRVAVIDRAESDEPLILLVAHHLVVDAVSWWVIVEDLETAYRALSAGNAVSLPPKTTSLLSWSRALQTYAQSESAKKTRDLWLPKASNCASGDPALMTDFDGANDFASRDTLVLSLGTRDTATLLTDAVSRWRIQPQDLLLAAFLTTMSSWLGRLDLSVDLEAHGREMIADELDLLRTVGWFTTVFPVHLSLERGDSPGDNLRRVKTTLRSIPHGGIAYGALRFMGEDPVVQATMHDQAPPVLLFNYLGKWRKRVAPDSIFSFERPVMATYGTSGSSPYVFEVNAAVFDGRLRVEWSYCRNLHRRDTVRELLENYGEAVRELVAYCAESADSEYAPTDFPAANLSQTELAEILDEFGES